MKNSIISEKTKSVTISALFESIKREQNNIPLVMEESKNDKQDY
jgi:hypothetical protein